jgi:hypothetical protein
MNSVLETAASPNCRLGRKTPCPTGGVGCFLVILRQLDTSGRAAEADDTVANIARRLRSDLGMS